MKWSIADDSITYHTYNGPYKLLGSGGAGIDEVYIELEINLCAPPYTGDGDFFDIVDLYGAGGQTYPDPTPFSGSGNEEGLYYNSPTQWHTETNGAINQAAGTGTHIIQLHLKCSTDIYTYTIDGITTDFSGLGFLPGYLNQLDGIVFGNGFGDYINSCTNVSVSTSAFGVGDIVADDFSSGTYAAWDGTVGTCYISASPVCYTPPPGPAPVMKNMVKLT